MDTTRRNLLTTGAVVAAATAAPRAFAQQPAKGAPGLQFFQKGNVRIRYRDVGAGLPVLIIPGGGQNSTIAWGASSAPFNSTEEFKNEFRCITADLRNAHSGESSGPLEIDRPWDSYTDDHLALMDQLGAKRFMIIGYCIGGPFIMNIIKRAPERVVAAVVAQPVGFNKKTPYMYDVSMKNWGPALIKRRPELTMDMIDRFLTRMYLTDADFMFTVTRDFMRTCQTPMLVMPDDTPAHPYEPAIECAMLAPKAEMSMYPWKEPKERIPLAVRHVRSFMRAHRLA